MWIVPSFTRSASAGAISPRNLLPGNRISTQSTGPLLSSMMVMVVLPSVGGD